ncbi:MAG: glycoside hydrolase [Bacteroidales bacterium]|nr:glycoside hydrolase [Bacteroidales bacterium]
MLCVLAALAGCGRNDGARERIDLAGEWNTEYGICRLPGTTDESHIGEYGLDTAVTGRLGRLYTFEDAIVYRKSIKIPRSFSGKTLRLMMERTKPSTLWVDGDSIGSFGHLYAPHVYILPSLEPGWHEIAIRVDNSGTAVPQEIHSSHAWSESTQTNWNGVLGNFCIEASEPVYIEKVTTWPSAARKEVEVRVTVNSDRDVAEASIALSASPFNTGCGKSCYSHSCKEEKFDINLSKGMNEFSFKLPLGDNALLWSEFHPALYRLVAVLDADGAHDSVNTEFGLRDFSTDGTQFTLNDLKTFLRGKHDACVFPLTGYAPMDVGSWRKVFATAKEYGINHYRCHSWTPPAAAFQAADIEGIYIQPELPLWGAIERGNDELNGFLMNEARMLLEEFGNHPSFMMFGLGNELHGDVTLMREWIDSLRRDDPRHLYCFGSNNNLGWLGPQDGEDFFVTCRVGWGEGYSSHVRTSFGFVDADKGGILNNTRPSTSEDYSVAISKSSIPVVGHETCQFQVYPDYSQIGKYTGVLYPYNLEIFRDRLEENGLSDQAEKFADATGKFSVECYKADMEYAFRTPGFGGFQMLDLQDYPGQGSALVGILDAFMDSKGAVEPEVFRGFCAPVVPMAKFRDYCWSLSDTLEFEIVVSNYLEKDLDAVVSWRLCAAGCPDSEKGRCNADSCHGSGCSGDVVPGYGPGACAGALEAGVSGAFHVTIAQGDVGAAGHVAVPLNRLGLDAASKLSLVLTVEDRNNRYGIWSNSYSLWAYPDYEISLPKAKANGKSCKTASGCISVKKPVDKDSGNSFVIIPLEGFLGKSKEYKSEIAARGNVRVFDAVNEELELHLGFGGRALLVPRHEDIENCSVGGLFTPDYWNWSMFKTISENAGKEVSPGTLSVLADPAHPALTLFPNDGRSDWQWWSITRNSRPMVLDALPKEYFPIVQVIDNVERNHKLGILFELSVWEGRLLVCTTDLSAISATPEGRAYIASIVDYFCSDAFRPSTAVTWDDVKTLFGNVVSHNDIHGVRNVTDYAAGTM